MSLLAWAELDREAIGAALRAGAPAVLPLGAVEQHGKHLATGTDTIMATYVVDRAATAARKPVLVLPAMPFGLSNYHARFGGTITLSATVLTEALIEIARSVAAYGGTRFFIVNGHGGNRGICTTVSLQVSTPTFHVITLSYWDLSGEAARTVFAGDHGSVGHAGQAETSMMLAVRPDVVHVEGQPAFEPIGAAAGLTAVQRLGETGVSGNPALGTAEAGAQFLDDVVARVAALFDGDAEIAPGTPA